MSRRTKKPRPSPAAASAPAQIQATESTYAFPGIGMGGGFTSADNTGLRGRVWFPNLNTKTELTSYARNEISRKGRWLARNTGLGKHCKRGVAKLIGALTPQPCTTDLAWNEEALAVFRRVTSAPLLFDRAGRCDFEEWQVMMTEMMLQDGDVFSVFTETPDGIPSNALFEGPQCSSGFDEGWVDGVRMDRNSRPTRYRFTSQDFDAEPAEIAARDVVHYGLFESPHAPRGVSGFAHAALSLLDIRELRNSTLAGLKAADQVGLALIAASDVTPSGAGLGSNINQPRNGSPYATPNTAPTASTPQRFEDVMGNGGNLAKPPPGYKFELLHDDRPHANREAFVESLIREIAWGFEFPPEVLWALGSTNGPGVRFMIKSGERAAQNYRRRLKRDVCHRIWTRTIARLIKIGELRAPSDPYWFVPDKTRWIAPESLTIDLGRDYKAFIEALACGGGTFEEWFGEASQDWREQLTQVADERVFIADLEKTRGLPPGTILGVKFQPPAPVQ